MDCFVTAKKNATVYSEFTPKRAGYIIFSPKTKNLKKKSFMMTSSKIDRA